MFEVPESFVDPIASSLAGPECTVTNAVRLVVGGQMFIVIVEHLLGEETLSLNYLFAHVDNFFAQEGNRPLVKGVFLLVCLENRWVVHTIDRIFSSTVGFVVETAAGEVFEDSFRIISLPSIPAESQVIWEKQP